MQLGDIVTYVGTRLDGARANHFGYIGVVLVHTKDHYVKVSWFGLVSKQDGTWFGRHLSNHKYRFLRLYSKRL